MDPQLLREDHHHLYGRPWVLGRYHFDFLVGHGGLRAEDHVLDFGCGSGRTGIHLIPYLDPGNYVGVDPDASRIRAFKQYEVLLHGLAPRNPTILATGTIPNREYDVVLDLFVIRHLRDSVRAGAEKRVKDALRSGGRLFRLGIEPVTHVQKAPAFTGTKWAPTLRWHVWTKP